ncbi:F420-dependent glucose-6-phosphate dehydrogenase [Candidatus Entotheonellaceae bacterium PAL068K]
MARLGMVLYHGLDSGPELKAYGRVAEEAGFDSLWVTERYFHEETFSMLGFLAASTTGLKLGLGVANPYTRHPALLAMASATLDRLCGGRFQLGLGRSDRFVIQDRMGIPYSRPRTRLEEAVTLIRALLAGEQLTATAGQFRLDQVRLAIHPRQPHLPIYLAAIGPQALRLAGAVADGVLLNAYVPTAYIRYAVQEVRQAAQAAGRDPAAIDIACMLVVRLTEQPETLWPGLKERLVRLLAEPHVGEILLDKGGFDPGILTGLRAAAALAGSGAADAVHLITDDMVNAFYLVGSAAQCRERLQDYREAGVQLPLLLPRLPDYRRVVEVFGQ